MNFQRLGAVVFVLASLAGLLLLGLVLAHWERARRTEGEQPLLSISAGITKSSLANSASSSTWGNSDARLLPGDALIIDEGRSPLTTRVAKILASSLLDSGIIRAVSVRRNPAGDAESSLGVLDQSPAFFLRIGDRDLEIGGMVGLRIKGDVQLSMGTSPWASDHSYQNEHTPPRLNFRWDSLLHVDLEVSGVSTDREEIAAREIARNLSGAVKKQLEEWQKSHALMPDLPATFYGEHRPAPALELPAGTISAPLISYGGLLSHNETFWALKPADDVAAQFQEIRKALEAAGWRVEDGGDSKQPYLRLTRGLGTVVAFRQSKSGFTENDQKEPSTYMLHYSERFADEERTAAIDELLATRNADALWAFESMMTPAQRERLLELPATTAGEYLQLARIQRAKKDKDAAVKSLYRAAALLTVQMDAGAEESQIRKELKELTGNDRLPEMNEELLEEAGFVEIVAGAEPSVSVRHADEPACFYYKQKNGNLRTFLMVVRPASGGMDTALQFVSSSGGGKSSSIRAGTKDASGKWRCDLSDSFDSLRMSGFAEEAESPDTYRLSARLVDDWAEPNGK